MEIPLCSNQGSGIFKANGKHQAALGARHRKYRHIFPCNTNVYNFLLTLNVSIDIDHHQTCYTSP